jgi:hypothetical protein
MAKRLEEYLDGRIGLSVRDVRLAGRSVEAVHAGLREMGFRHWSSPLVASRSPTGGLVFRCVDGSTTTDPAEPYLATIETYVHPDGGMIRVFPRGDPEGRLVPASGPAAIKSVLLPPDVEVGPVAPRGAPPPGAPPSPQPRARRSREAFKVTDDGEPLPRGLRASDGLKDDPGDAKESHRLALEALGYATIALAPDERSRGR